MRRGIGIFILLILLGAGRLQAQQESSPWQSIVPLAEFGYGSLYSVYWSPLNEQLAAVSQSGLQFYDADLRLEGLRYLTDTPINEALFSPDMRYVAVSEAAGLLVRDTATWEPLLAISDFYAPSWSPNSQYLAIWVGDDLQVWDVTRAATILEMTEIIGDGVAAQWSPDSAVIAIPAGDTIVLLNVLTGEIVQVHGVGEIRGFAWSADGRWLLIVGRAVPLPGDYPVDQLRPLELFRMDAVTGEIVMHYNLSAGATEGVFSVRTPVSISPNGRYVSAYLQKAADLKAYQWEPVGMGIWAVESGEPLTGVQYDPLQVSYTSWSPDGTQFATSQGSTLEIYAVASGQRTSLFSAYLSGAGDLIWDESGIVTAGGLWDVRAEYPQFAGERFVPAPPPDFIQPEVVECTNRWTELCPPVMVPDPTVYNYRKPPYDFELLYDISARGYLISYEREIEYIGTPEYEDGEPPFERFVLWDANTGERMERYLNQSSEQTAYIYDLPNAEVIASESHAFNVLRNTYFISIDDDEITNLRTGDRLPLEGVQTWEWREVWFSPDDGKRIYAYETDGTFKAFDPWTGKLLYQTVAAPRYGLSFNHNFELTYVIDHQQRLHIYDTATGREMLDVYTENSRYVLAWNADRSLVAIGGDNQGIILVDVPRGERLGVLRGHQAGITSMAWNPACDLAQPAACRYVLASTDEAGKVILWGNRSQQQAAQEIANTPAEPVHDPLTADINFKEMQPLWTFLDTTDQAGKPAAQTVMWTEGGIRINGDTYYAPDFTEYEEPPDANWIEAQAISPDGVVLLPGGTIIGSDGVQTGDVAAQQWVADAIFNRTGERIITAEGAETSNRFNGWVGEYSAISGQPFYRWGGGNPGFNQVALSPNGAWIATSTVPYYQLGGRVQIWFANRFNTQYASLIGHQGGITGMFWDGEAMITAGEDGTVRRWNIHTALPVARWDEPTRGAVRQMEWLGSNALLVSAGASLYILDPQTLEVQREIAGVGGGRFDWSPEGDELIVVGADALLRVVDFASGAVLATQTQHHPAITGLAWKPDGAVLAISRQNGSVALVDSTTGTQTALLRPYGVPVQTMQWSPDGSKLLLDVRGGALEVIDGVTGALITQIENRWRRAGAWWSPDGTQIAYGTYPDPNESVYHAPSRLNIHRMDGTLVHSFDLEWRDYIFYWQKKPFDLVWSPDGQYIVAIYKDSVRAWNLQTGALIGAAHTGIGNQFALGVWNERVLTFWMQQSTWQFNLADNTLLRLAEEGLSPNAVPRTDNIVALGDQQIIHLRTGYPFQALPQGYVAAAWHPTCWTTDCERVLAVASGSSITMYGYPAE